MRLSTNMSKLERTLVVLFLASLPFVEAQIRLDGISYYGVTRSLIVDHNLQFSQEWRNTSGRPSMDIRDPDGHVRTVYVTKTGHRPMHSPIGASLMWMPFIAVTHGAVLLLNHLGAHISSNGLSEPYLVTVAGATCLYAFMGLWLSFRMARRYVDERWAFLATLALWLGSSLCAYIYVDPAWSHAHSVFAVALFLWYWMRTREYRSPAQWFVLGLISGLMVEIYFPNAVFLLIPSLDFRSHPDVEKTETPALVSTVRNYSLCALAALIALIPTFVIRTILFGSPLSVGAYGNRPWNWTSPAYLQVLFSPSQGLLTTTPIVALAIVGMFFLLRRDKTLARRFILVFAAFCTLIAAYPFWNLGPAFGNRYFISLTPIFIIGLSCLLAETAKLWKNAGAFRVRAWVVATILIVWNLGLVFQWQLGLMPDAGRVYWDEMLYNEFRVVPGEALRAIQSRFSLHPQHNDNAPTAASTSS